MFHDLGYNKNVSFSKEYTFGLCVGLLNCFASLYIPDKKFTKHREVLLFPLVLHSIQRDVRSAVLMLVFYEKAKMNFENQYALLTQRESRTN